jgi:hypothetical protein
MTLSRSGSLHAIKQTRLPIPTRRRTVGARAAIVAQFEQRGLAAFALFPCLDLLAAQFTEALPTDPVNALFPSGLKATDVTVVAFIPSSPLNERSCFPVVASRRKAVP